MEKSWNFTLFRNGQGKVMEFDSLNFLEKSWNVMPYLISLSIVQLSIVIGIKICNSFNSFTTTQRIILVLYNTGILKLWKNLCSWRNC